MWQPVLEDEAGAATHFLVDTLKKHHGSVTILSIGIPTNLALALDTHQ